MIGKNNKAENAIFIKGRRWFDRINGNTYHSVTIEFANGRESIYVPMTYGYEDQYLSTAIEALKKAKIIRKVSSVWQTFERLTKRGITVYKSVTDGLKREL